MPFKIPLIAILTSGLGTAFLFGTSVGQEIWGKPKPLGPPVNTQDYEICPVLTPDLRHLFFGRADTSARYWIWHSVRTATGWGDPERLPEPVNTLKGLELPCAAETTGEVIRLYFCSQRPGGLGGADILFSDLRGGSWGPAQNLGSPINSPAHECGITFSNQGKRAVFTSDRGDAPTIHDLWEVSLKGSAWVNPVELPRGINTSLSEQNPALTEDGNTLYFHRTGPGTQYPERIFVAHRVKGEWQPGREAPSPIYDVGNDSESPWISPDGRYLFFSSDRPGNFRNPDLWVTGSKKGGMEP